MAGELLRLGRVRYLRGVGNFAESTKSPGPSSLKVIFVTVFWEFPLKNHG